MRHGLKRAFEEMAQEEGYCLDEFAEGLDPEVGNGYMNPATAEAFDQWLEAHESKFPSSLLG